jgi:hypothetical protein
VRAEFSQAAAPALESAASVKVSVHLSAAAGQPINVPYAVTGGTAVNGVDYKLSGGTLAFRPGTTTATLSVPLRNDHLDKPDDTIELSLLAPTGAALGDTTDFTLTIQNTNPAPTVAFAKAALTISQAVAEPIVPVTLSAASGQTVTIGYAVTGGTATDGTDFHLGSGTLTFAPGVKAMDLPLSVVNHKDATSRTIQVTLSSPTEASLGKTQVLTCTIAGSEPGVGFDATGPTIGLVSSFSAPTDSSGIQVAGTVVDELSGVAMLQVQVDGGSLTAVPLDPAGNFSIHVPLPGAGPHRVILQAIDNAGNTTQTIVPEFDLSAGSDDGTSGDHSTTAGRVTLIGHATAGAVVELVGTSLQTTANNAEVFQFPNIALAMGSNPFTVRAAARLGAIATFNVAITRTAASTQPNAVIVWNQAALAAIQVDGTDPLFASRGLAMVQAAVFDAVNAIEGAPAYYVKLSAAADANEDAAIDRAAHDVLTYLYPAQQATFDALLTSQIALLAGGQGTTDGEAVGQAAANAIIALRSNDGSRTFVEFMGGTSPGDWLPTAPSYAPPLDPQWANLTPFALSSPDQFQPSGPPMLSSQAWADAVNQVESLGAVHSTTRTADQTQIAQFWNDATGTATPPGHWNAIAETVAQTQGDSLAADARLFAELDVALADAGITAWNAKYAYDTWRPITVIQAGGDGVNPSVTADPAWFPLLTTPNFPEYVSGHSTFSGAAATVLDAFFGTGVGFSSTEPTLPGVTRSFTGFDQAAQEAGMSRIYAGIHFIFSDLDGVAAGQHVAQFVLGTFNVAQDTMPPRVTLNQVSGQSSHSNVTISGIATDNLSGVQSLQVRVDGGLYGPLTFDAATGEFAYTTTFALTGSDDGQHTISIEATDAAGNVAAPATFAFTLATKAPTLTLNSPTDGGSLAVGATLAGLVTTDGSIPSVDTSMMSGPVPLIGNTLVALSYAFDRGAAVPVPFNIDYSFSQTLDLAKLAAGAHTLTITAQDAAGNVTTQTLHLTLAAPIPLTVASLLPGDGSSDVGVTYRPSVTFSRPINPTTLSSANFYATDSTGTTIPATVVPSDDGTSAWLFFTNPLPGGSAITLTVDGSTIMAGDGSLLDAAGTGTPGSTLTAAFTTVNEFAVPNTTLSGIVADPGADNRPMTRDDVLNGPDGVLGTADDIYLNPIAGATVCILGHQDQAVVSGADGSFALASVPTGDVKLVVDGRTATNAPAGTYYPEMVFDLTIRPGIANTVMGSMGSDQEQAANATARGAYLPRLQSSILQSAGGGSATTIDLSANASLDLTPAQQAAVSITVAPNSLVGTNGQKLAGGQVGVSVVSPALVRDMLPPGVMQLATTLTIQAPGVALFSTPLEMTFPNVYDAAPGTQLNVYSFNHTTGLLEITGTATVSADGTKVVTDPGSGITHPGWYGTTPPGSGGSGGGGGGGNNKDGDQKKKDDKCDQALNAAESATAQCLVGAGLGLIETTPVIGCAISIAQGIVGASVDSHITPNDKAFTWFKAGVGALIGCIPVFGGPLSVLYTCTLATSDSIDNYNRCIGVSGSAVEDLVARDTLAPIPNLCRQQLDLVTSGDALLVAFLGSSKWINGAPADIDKATGFLQALTDAYTADGPGKALTPTQQTALLKLPLPSNITLADAQAVISRLNAYFTNPTGDTAFDQNAVVAAAQNFGAVAARLQQAGWTTTVDMFTRGLPAVTAAIREAAAGFPPTPGLFYKLTNLATGAVLRGRLDESGQFKNVILAPISLYSAEYFDLPTGQIGATVFKTATSGAPTPIPIGILAPSTSPDTDGDGLSDAAEAIVGTDPTKASTAGDGIGDLAALQSGLNPLAPISPATGIAASVPLQGQATRVLLQSSTAGLAAYVATGTYGLALVDVTQFQKPLLLSQIALSGNSSDVAVDDHLHIAAVASNAGGLNLVDVSKPNHPAVFATIAVNATHVSVYGGVAYTAVGAKLSAYDMLTGKDLQDLTVGSTAISALARDGTLLYALDASGTLHVVDLGNHQMTARGTLSISGTGNQLVAGNGIAYVTTSASSIATIDVSNPDSPALLDAPPLSINTNGIAATGSGQVVTAGDLGGTPSLDVIDVHDPLHPAAEAHVYLSLTNAPIHSVAIGDGIAFVADDTGGLVIATYLPFDTVGKPPTVTIGTPSLQVAEGSMVPLTAQVSDDVQIRDLEVLVNGQIAQDAGTFPFGLSAPMPTIADAGAAAVTVQVQATDTGGNITRSNTLTVQLTPDTTGPTLLDSSVPDGSVLNVQVPIVLQFSKPLDPATVTASNFALQGPGGTVLTPAAITTGTTGVVELTYPVLQGGSYTFTIDAAAVTDQVGNPLGTGTITSHFQIAAPVDSWINPGGGDWDTPANWSTGAVPGPSQDVTIKVPGNVVITHSTGTDHVHSIRSTDAFHLTGGTLQVSGTMEVDNAFTIQGGTLQGATVLPGSSGQGISVSDFGTGTLDGVTLDCSLTMVEKSTHGGTINVRNGLTLGNGAVIQLGDSSTNNDGSISFYGSQLLTGTGTVLLGNYSDNIYMEGTDTLTIDTGITIHGGTGTIYGGAVVNKGTIISDGGGTIAIAATNGFINEHALAATNASTLSMQYVWTNDAGGTITTTGAVLNLGDQRTVPPPGGWTNLGTITASNATVNLGGSFTIAGMGTFNHTNATVNVTGVLNASVSGLHLDAGTGSWNLMGGTIEGGLFPGGNAQTGTYTASGGAALNFTSARGTLAGVIADSDLNFNVVSSGYTYQYAYVTNGLTLDNVNINLGDAAGIDYGILAFTGNQALGGTGTILAGKNSSNSLGVDSNTTLTIGANITIRGSQAVLYSSAGFGGTIIDQGPIFADDTGGLVGGYAYDPSTDSNTSIGLITAPIDTSAIANPAPQAVYQTYRSGFDFSYALTGLAPGATYTVRLDLAEPTYTSAGGRVFNVKSNGAAALANVDIFKVAGARNKAVQQTFTTTADGSGQISLEFTSASGANPLVNGIAVLDSGGTMAAAINCGLLAGGTVKVIPNTLQNHGSLAVSNGEALIVSGLTGNLGSATLTGTGSQLSVSGTSWTIDQNLAAANGQTLSLGGSWTNAATFTASNATVNLGGTFTLAGLGTFNRTAGTVNLTGTLDASASGLALDATTGSWNLKGGTLKGGTYSASSGAALVFTKSGGTLDGVTADSDLVIAGPGGIGASATVADGLTLGGVTIYLGDAFLAQGTLDFSGNQTLGGTGTVLMGKAGGNILMADSGYTLTLGPNITVRGSNGNIEGYPAAGVINKGTIIADDSGGLVDGYAYDTEFSGGTNDRTTDTIDVSEVTNPAPSVLYQTYRDGQYGPFSYNLAGLSPNAPYSLLLSFADPISTAVGQRRFNVNVNSAAQLTNFDIFATAGARDRAVTESLNATTDGTGKIQLAFNAGASGVPLVNAIEVLAGASVVQAINCGDLPGGTIRINPVTFTNQGTVSAINSGTLELDGPGPNSGTIAAGVGGVINIYGTFTQTATSTLEVDITGTGAGQFGVINVNGTATLAGTLTATFVNGFAPASGSTFKVLKFTSATGTFSTVTAVNLPNSLSLSAVYNTTDVTIDVS